MMTSARALCIGCTATLLAGTGAQAQEACTTYVVAAGDNLRYIARSAYGDSDMFRVIYQANVATIGAKADLIEIGASLVIPCDPRNTEASAAPVAAIQPGVELATGVIDPAKQPVEVVPDLPVVAAGQASATGTDATVVEAAAEAPVAASAPEPVAAQAAPVRMLTGNGYAPFVDEMLPGGGMFTQIVEMAIFRADPAIPYNLTFISDWQAHIDALLPAQAYDLSFPWVRPDCDVPATLSAGDLTRCENFEFSAPYYEIVDGFFARADSELVSATNFALFEGKRICRPEGYTTGVLDAVGLSVPRIELLRPLETTDCFEALATGKVDLVSIDAEVGDSAIASLGMTGDFLQNPHLTTLLSLHVIAHKSNPRAVEMIQQLDGGLVEMYESGEWYEIVSTALSQTNKRQ
ncbi:transporter substrate-binding domain-containing protein [Tabrizicola sp.]|uniref:transporter substrate-binding domain-containing protein n=1 Tax=Tabrizicola sp. TaxID=2005166 RepID=UPI002615C338|nr:transporter substrate-binding domain-containing protein [Tabrizicola sp.]MDM7930337.1 transporter substrate-binding domain-containing protein [Tabrizicola sp.]